MVGPLRRLFVSCCAVAAFAAIAPRVSAETWVIDTAHSRLGFAVKHLAVAKVRGNFRKFSGEIILDEQDVSKSKATIQIVAASIDTGEAKRDNHLRSNDFFDVAKYPTISFVGRTFEKIGTNGLRITGDLTIKSVTKPVIFQVLDMSAEHKDPGGGARRGGSARAIINRQEFNLTWNNIVEGVGAVGDDVAIEVDVEVTKKVEATATTLPSVATPAEAPPAKKRKKN